MEMQWMTMEEIRARKGGDTPVIVPFGTVEQHGPHLPLSTDTQQAYAVALMAARIVPAIVAPPVHYGQCSSTRNHPGTITLTGNTLRSLAGDLIRSFSRQGFTRIILFSGHAGSIHMSALREAAQMAVDTDPSLRLAVVCDLDLVREGADGLLETPGDGHAGEIETSRMLFLHPDHVGELPKEEYPEPRPGIVVPDPERYWPGGVWGNPRAASDEKGRLLMEITAQALAGIVETIKSG